MVDRKASQYYITKQDRANNDVTGTIGYVTFLADKQSGINNVTRSSNMIHTVNLRNRKNIKISQKQNTEALMKEYLI